LIIVTHGGQAKSKPLSPTWPRFQRRLKLMRIEAGLPAWGHELSDAVTPLEVNLLPAVSFDKGCYVGQEVIARQTNYDKITRRMVGLVFGPDAPADVEGARPGLRQDGSDLQRIRLATAARSRSPSAGLAEPDAAVTVLHHEQPYEAQW
jgi:folate-binding protein YgfZ